MARLVAPILLMFLIALFGTLDARPNPDEEGHGKHHKGHTGPGRLVKTVVKKIVHVTTPTPEEPRVKTEDGLITGVANSIKNTFTGVVDDVEGVVDTVTGGKKKSGLGKLFSVFGRGVGDFFKDAASGITNGIEAATSGLGEAINQARIGFDEGDLGFRAAKAVKALGQGAVNIAKAGTGAVKKFAFDLGDDVNQRPLQ